MSFAEGEDFLTAETVSSESDDVDFHDFGGIALMKHEGDTVGPDSGHGTDESESSDGDPLMNADHSGDDNVVIDVGVATDLGHVGDDDLVADVAIVGDVDTGHEEIVGSDARDAELFGGCAMDRATFPESVSVADDGPGRFTAVAEILRLAADDRLGIEDVVVADTGMAHDGHVIEKPSSRADERVGSNDTVGPDMDIVIEDGMGINDGSRIDVKGHVSSVARLSCEPDPPSLVDRS